MSWSKWSKKRERDAVKDKEMQDKADYIASMSPERRARYEHQCEVNRINAAHSLEARKMYVKKNKIKELIAQEDKTRKQKIIDRENAIVIDSVLNSLAFENLLDERAGVRGQIAVEVEEDDPIKLKEELDQAVKETLRKKAIEEEEVRKRETNEDKI